MSCIRPVVHIQSVADMWGVLNHIPNSYVGVANIFVMEHNLEPLWEMNSDVFQAGGCWSVVIRHHPWATVLNEIVMALCGEAFFDIHVKGVCVIPVTQQHTICKIWCTRENAKDAHALTHALARFRASGARFKRFLI